MNIESLLDKLEGVRRNGSGYIARCPAHDDNTASLSVSEGEEGKTLLHCHAGCAIEDIIDAMGVMMRDLRDESNPEAVYVYTDENKAPLYEVCRYPGKIFRQKNAAGEWNIRGIRRVIYQLPQVLEQSARGGTVYVVEGEKDVHALMGAGKVATCNMGGAGKWSPDYADHLRGANVIVVADKDEPGRKHAEQVRDSLAGVAKRVWVVQAREGKDAYDHLDAGYAVEEFEPIGEETDDERFVTAARIARNFLARMDAPPEKEVYYGNPWLVDDIEFAPGGLYIVGGDTGLGKSNLALDLFRYLSEQGVSVGYVTNEMTEPELTNRLICHYGGFYGTRKLRRPSTLNQEERAAATRAAGYIAGWQSAVIYDESAGHEKVGEYVERGKFAFVIFDHLHLTESAVAGDKSALDREIRGFKRMALRHKIPVLVLSQLRRPNPLNPFAPPTRHDFNGSSAIENASSISAILWRPSPNAYRLSVVKNRDGDEPNVDLTFDKHTLRFAKPKVAADVSVWQA